MAQLHPFMHVAVISSMMFYFFLLSTPYRLTHMWAVLSSSRVCVLIDWMISKVHQTLFNDGSVWFWLSRRVYRTSNGSESKSSSMRNNFVVSCTYRWEMCNEFGNISFFPFAIIPSESLWRVRVNFHFSPQHVVRADPKKTCIQSTWVTPTLSSTINSL